MHYVTKRKNREKVRLDLYFKQEILEILQEISEFENVSMSQVIERGILYGYGEKWEKAKAKSYKKKSLCAKKNTKKNKKAVQTTKYAQECLYF